MVIANQLTIQINRKDTKYLKKN